MSQTPTHALPSYLNADDLGPWGNYLQQVDRVTPYLGSLARWVETLKRPKRSLIVDVPIELDNGTIGTSTISARFGRFSVSTHRLSVPRYGVTRSTCCR